MRRFLLALLVALAIVAPAGAWTWPADGPVLQPFSFDPDAAEGARLPPRRRRRRAGSGAVVRAPAAGVVSFAGVVPGNGRCVTIETADGWSVTLTHLGSIAVTKGASVVEGDGVGTIGPSDESGVTDPHVHLGIRRTIDEFGYVDPATFLPAAPVGRQPSRHRWRLTRRRLRPPRLRRGSRRSSPPPVVQAAGAVAPASSAASSGSGPSAGESSPPGSPPPTDVPPAPASTSPAPSEAQLADRSDGRSVERRRRTASPVSRRRRAARAVARRRRRRPVPAAAPPATTAPQPEPATRADLSPAQSPSRAPRRGRRSADAAPRVAVAAPAEEPVGPTPSSARPGGASPFGSRHRPSPPRHLLRRRSRPDSRRQHAHVAEAPVVPATDASPAPSA